MESCVAPLIETYQIHQNSQVLSAHPLAPTLTTQTKPHTLTHTHIQELTLTYTCSMLMQTQKCPHLHIHTHRPTFIYTLIHKKRFPQKFIVDILFIILGTRTERIKSINQSNCWFNVQIFIREDDSDAQRMMWCTDIVIINAIGRCCHHYRFISVSLKPSHLRRTIFGPSKWPV